MSSPLRVMVLSHIREVSGAEIVTLNLFRNNPALQAVYVGPAGDYADAFRRDGHEVVIAEELLHHRIADEGAVWYPLFPFRVWRATAAIRDAIARHAPDVIFTIHAYDLLYLWGIPRGSAPPVIWICHAIYGAETRVTPLVSSISQRADKILAVSQAVKSRLIELGLSGDRIEVVRNGVDVRGRFNPETTVPAVLPGSGYRVGILGRIYPLKGIHVALDAIERAPDRNRINLVVAGAPWPGHEKYEADLKARALRLAPATISFLGSRTDVPQLLAALDAVLVPSVEPDSLPTTALEAMAMARTLVASRIGGLIELVDHGKTGYLFEPGNADQLARLWFDLASSALPSTGAAARAYVQKELSMEHWQAALSEKLRR